jgi:hypothetical protein
MLSVLLEARSSVGAHLLPCFSADCAPDPPKACDQLILGGCQVSDESIWAVSVLLLVGSGELDGQLCGSRLSFLNS